MAIVDPAQGGASPLVARVKGILLSPSSEWDRIDQEPTTIQGLYAGYVIILVAIATVSTLIGRVVFGAGAFGLVFHPSILRSLIYAAVSFGLALAGVYL